MKIQKGFPHSKCWQIAAGERTQVQTSTTGFTLVEIILYVALLAIMMSAVLPIALQLINSGTKSGVTQEVYQSARYVS